MPTGRFAPSPTGHLHLGNLRTALLAWLFARSEGGRFLLRVEDLDPTTARPELEASQLADLTALGLDWDGPVLHQSQRQERHQRAIDELVQAGLTYQCYCTRREIREAPSAPHDDLPEGAYPGTCRRLTAAQRAEREATGRRPALRLRAEGAELSFTDRLHGEVHGRVDDVVLRRNDGTPAYNLAVVVDDAEQGVAEVVRGDDLLDSTPRQLLIARHLGLRAPAYAHVPLVLAPSGARLAKRDGAVTLADRARRGETPGQVCALLAWTLGLTDDPAAPVRPVDLLPRFDPGVLPRQPWTVPARLLGSSAG